MFNDSEVYLSTVNTNKLLSIIIPSTGLTECLDNSKKARTS